MSQSAVCEPRRCPCAGFDPAGASDVTARGMAAVRTPAPASSPSRAPAGSRDHTSPVGGRRSSSAATSSLRRRLRLRPQSEGLVDEPDDLVAALSRRHGIPPSPACHRSYVGARRRRRGHGRRSRRTEVPGRRLRWPRDSGRPPHRGGPRQDLGPWPGPRGGVEDRGEGRLARVGCHWGITARRLGERATPEGPSIVIAGGGAPRTGVEERERQ